MKTRHPFAAALIPLALLLAASCGPGRDEPQTPQTQDHPPPRAPEGFGPLNFCEQIGPSIQSIGAGFECLKAPNWIDRGVFGPRSYPNQDTLEGQLGAIPPYVFTDGGNPYSGALKAGKTFNATGGLALNLSDFVQFLPTTKINVQGGSEVSIDLQLRDIRIVKVQNIDRLLAEKMKESPDSAARALSKLCKDDQVISVASIAAAPIVAVKSTSGLSTDGALGYKNIAGIDFKVEQKSGNELLISSEKSLVIAVQIRDSNLSSRTSARRRRRPFIATPTATAMATQLR
jgi:hypothetical protein